jgi:hypothetical protein
MRPIAILAMVLAGAACAPVTPPTAATPAAQAGAAASAPACQTTTVPVTVGGRPEQATIEACPQPDGSWQITQTTPGLPPQVYLMPAPPADVYPAVYPDYWDYFDYWPYWAAGPWFWGIGPTVVIVERFRHHRDIDHGGPGHPGHAGHPSPHGFGHAVAAGPAGGGMRR